MSEQEIRRHYQENNLNFKGLRRRQSFLRGREKITLHE